MRKLAGVFLFLCLLFPAQTFAFWPDLSTEQKEEAIKYGKDLANQLGADSTWSVRSERGAGWVELTTPFSAVAKLSRERTLASKPIREKDIKNAAAPYKNKLVFNYFHYEIEARFSTAAETEYFPMIRTADQQILYPLRYDKGREEVKKVSLEFTFPVDKIDPNSVIVLVVREPSGYEHEFKFDLSKIK
jgi:hypothetical protein